MWPPVSGRLSPLTPTPAEVAPDIETEPQGIVQTREIRDKHCQRRSMQQVARSEPLFRRVDIRQQPYLVPSITQRHNLLTKGTNTEQERALDVQITNEDIQAATILMLFAKSIYSKRNCTNISTMDCVMTSNKHSTKDCPRPPHWLETLLRQPYMMSILRGLSIPPFASRERQRWENKLNLVVSCMMVRRVVPSMPVPVLLQQTIHVAEQLINDARLKKMPSEQDVCCPDCGLLPVLPITGQCGHTRCLECVQTNSTCTCGVPAPQDLHVDTCIQYLVGKMLANNEPLRVTLPASERPPVRGRLLHDFVRAIYYRVVQENCQALARRRTVAQRLSRGLGVPLAICDIFTAPDVPARLPMTPQARVLRACEHIRRQRYPEAAVHLARAATYSGFDLAKRLLVQTIAILLEDQEPERVVSEVSSAISQQAAATWLSPHDLECILCRDTLVAPVTTPCGHTYCRHCIEHSMDYQRTCPLCMRDLDHFNLALTRKTQFMCAALASINLLHSPPLLDPSIVPVFICVTAFPKVPCPLLISDPRYRVFIRRILESGTRRLGVVARSDDHTDSDYGTMLEVRDCVECVDGRIFLSTIGISRFKIVERVMDGCLARVEMLTDKVPTDVFMLRVVRIVGYEVIMNALIWLKNLDYSVRSQIERAFGKIPLFEEEEEWWSKPDGPEWLWWLVASLPLAPELKGMMISSRKLLTRLRVMRRSLLYINSEPYEEALRYSPQ